MVASSIYVDGKKYIVDHILKIKNDKFHVKSTTVYKGKQIGLELEEENINLKAATEAIKKKIIEKNSKPVRA